jgi:GT2 family glycosyltransferase
VAASIVSKPARSADVPVGPISVVVVNFDGSAHLPACLEALFAQSLVPDEVLLVDNASSDGSEARALAEHPKLQLLRLAKNEGPCPARNAGLAAARNAWVLLLDNDAVLMPDTLERLAQAAAQRPEAVVLQPRSVFATEPERVHYDGGSLHYVGLFSLRNFYTPLSQALGQGSVEVDGVVSVALLVKRELLLAIGGFDARFFILFEDLDLSLRLRLMGHTLLSVEEALVLHRGGTPGISFRSGADYPKRRAFLHSRNRWFVLLKNYRWRTLLVAAPGLLLYEAAWLAFALLGGSLGAHLRGKWAFLAELPSTLAARREVQKLRRLRDRELLVGGPLTITPGLRSSGLRGALLRGLDAGLALWWQIARRFAG